MKNTTPLLLASFLMVTASPLAIAQSANNQQSAQTRAMNSSDETQDQDFVQAAALGNLTEIQAGQIAQRQSKNQRVKSFAQQLVQDHRKALNNLKRRAGDLTIPSQLDSEHKQMISQLQNANGNFDETFVQMQVDAHQDAIDTYQEYVSNGQDRSLRRYARNTLPTLRNHLRTAENLQGNSSGQASNRSGNSQRMAMQNDGRQAMVTVRESDPNITVQQGRPQITVRQAAPRVTIEQPQPQIIVRMPKPDVNVSDTKPQVSVRMPKPRVNVIDQNNGDNVDINQARPQVTYQRAGQPKVIYRQAQGAPTVLYEDANGNRLSDQNGSMDNGNNDQSSRTMQSGNRQSANNDQYGSDNVASTNVGQSGNNNWETVARTRATAGDNGVNTSGRTQQVRISQLTDMSLYNAQGDNLGDVEQIVLDTDNNQRYLVLAAGGFLGMFEDEVALPLNRVHYENGRLVIRGITDNDIDQMQDWKQKLPHRRVLSDNDTASIVYTNNS